MNAPEPGFRRPVTIVTGFLGSGKTTTLARALKAPEFAGAIAIINEFGEVGLDHLLIETSEERFALLDNGCICCTIRDDLVETLLGLIARADAGQLPDFKRVVVETTGLADPAPILHALMAQERLAASFFIDGVVTTIDAVNGLATLAAHPEAAKQAAVADRLLLTKIDIAVPAGLSALEARLAVLNPTAERVYSRFGDAPASGLIDIGSQTPRDLLQWFDRAALASRRSGFRADGCDADCNDRECDDPRHRPRHMDGISTFCVAIDQPVKWSAFKQWLEYLALLKGEDLLRFKGLLQIEERPETPIVVQGVQHIFHPPRELECWPDADRRSRLVFITRRISRETIVGTLCKFAGVDIAATNGFRAVS